MAEEPCPTHGAVGAGASSSDAAVSDRLDSELETFQAEAAAVPSALRPVAFKPHDYSSFCSSFADFLVDPTHLFSFASQPPEVRWQAFDVLLKELKSWLQRGGAGEDSEKRQLDQSLWYQVQTSHEEVYDLVTGVLDSMDGDIPWAEVPHADGAAPPSQWNLWWTWGKPRVVERSVWVRTQLVNHIPKSYNLTRKDLLKGHLQRYSKGRDKSEFSVMPPSFLLPREYVGFVKQFAESGGIWIMKTVGMSRGRGIALVKSIEDVKYSGPTVIQRYIDRPMKIDGKFKFDMRLYVLVTQFSPLEAFISNMGFARIAAHPYDLSTLDDKYAHLTNTSISTKAKGQGNRSDTKWLLPKLRRYLEGRGLVKSWDVTWRRVVDAVLRALSCAQDAIPCSPCCFELFGFDVLLDELGKPWVLEVNASPSMEITSPEDEELKPQLIEDIVRLVDPMPINRFALMEVLIDALRVDRRRHLSPSATLEETNRSLHQILGGRIPRAFGQLPSTLGSFSPIAPTPLSDDILRQKRNV
jgi:hypothetical protein